MIHTYPLRYRYITFHFKFLMPHYKSMQSAQFNTLHFILHHVLSYVSFQISDATLQVEALIAFQYIIFVAVQCSVLKQKQTGDSGSGAIGRQWSLKRRATELQALVDLVATRYWSKVIILFNIHIHKVWVPLDGSEASKGELQSYKQEQGSLLRLWSHAPSLVDLVLLDIDSKSS